LSTSSDPRAAEPPFARVAVLGLGVMGGSLGRSLAGAAPEVEVRGWSPDAGDADAARASGAFDAVAATLAETVAGADLVVLASPPVAAMDALVEAAEAAPDAVLTDVVSVKAPLARSARDSGLLGRWVGSHPMAGSEASGFAASRPDLFRGARVWIVSEGAPAPTVERIRRFWAALGGEPVEIDAAAHDELMGLVSHLPQLTATALASVLMELGVRAGHLGPGGADMTRLAASSPEMWGDLLELAPDGAARGLRALAAEGARLADLIESGRVGEVTRTMDRARAWRAKP